MKKSVLFIVLISMFWTSAIADKWKLYEVVDTIPIRNVSKKKVYNDVQDWFEKTSATKLVRLNPNSFEMEGKSFFIYYNRVEVEDVFLSPRAAERTAGTIQYTINVKVLDSIVIAKATSFTHEAYYSPYGQISFGNITDYESVPPGKCVENKIWCNKVWSEMKEKSFQDATTKFANIVPSLYRRSEGKNFNKKDEQPVDTAAKAPDPRKYLNLDQYLIKE